MNNNKGHEKTTLMYNNGLGPFCYSVVVGETGGKFNYVITSLIQLSMW